MEEYLLNRPTYLKKVIFVIRYYEGGIADFIKFFLFLIQLCIQKQLKIYFAITDLRLNKWLKLKYPEFYYIPNNEVILDDISQLDMLDVNIDYTVYPKILYSTFSYDKLYLKGSDIFTFSSEIIELSKGFSLEKYVSIHVRLGDKFLEIPLEQNQCINDVRHFNEEAVLECIQQNPGILVFCDNLKYKQKLQQTYKIELTAFKIGHTCLPTTSDEVVMDSLTEFYILAKSQHIFISNDSGFSKMAANFYNVPFTILKK
jgi:hypothetical protein